jgi:hypothetical protein
LFRPCPSVGATSQRVHEETALFASGAFRGGNRVKKIPLEHDPEKWEPVFRKDHAQTKRLDHDAIPLNRIMI